MIGCVDDCILECVVMEKSLSCYSTRNYDFTSSRKRESLDCELTVSFWKIKMSVTSHDGKKK